MTLRHFFLSVAFCTRTHRWLIDLLIYLGLQAWSDKIVVRYGELDHKSLYKTNPQNKSSTSPKNNDRTTHHQRMTELRNYTCWEFPAHVTFLWVDSDRFHPSSTRQTHTRPRYSYVQHDLRWCSTSLHCPEIANLSKANESEFFNFTGLTNHHSSLWGKKQSLYIQNMLYIYILQAKHVLLPYPYGPITWQYC